jgi:protein-tyrosine phosphatase
MIDFHCHILPAIDDGAVSIDESITMAKSLSAFGYKTVCCTPHCIKGYYNHNPQEVREATLMLQADLDNADIPLELWPGMEYMLDEYFSEYIDDLLPLGETKLVLCEAPPLARPGYVLEGLKSIVKKGFVPLIAHPERTQYFYEMILASDAGDEGRGEKFEMRRNHKPQTTKQGFLKKLFNKKGHAQRTTNHEPANSTSKLPENCFFQANLGSFSGYYGSQVQARAYELLKMGTYNCIASDLHDCAPVQDVLQRDKLEFNPFLKKLSEFNGVVPDINNALKSGEGEQIGLF